MTTPTKTVGMTFLEALKTGRPMRRSCFGELLWIRLGRQSSPGRAPTIRVWRDIDTGEVIGLDEEDYFADDWQVMP